MKSALKKIVLTAACLTCGLVSIAQAPPDSLLQYLSIAAKNNPAVLQRFSEYKAAVQKVPQAGGLPDPELNVGVFIQPMELLGGKQYADLRLMQMFPWFGTLKSAKDEMSLAAEAKYEAFRDAQLRVFFDVRKTWNELQKIREDIRITGENIAILHTIEGYTMVKFKAAGPAGQPGDAGLADLYRVQIEIGDLENDLALLKDSETSVRAMFNSYLDRPPLSEVALPGKLVPDSLGIPVEAVTDTMLAHNPELGMLRYEQLSSRAREKTVTMMSYPMLGLGVNYSVIGKSDMSASPMNGRDMIMPMATVTIPIYRKKYNAMQTEAKLMSTAAGQDYQSRANALETEYYEAVRLYKDGQRRMVLFDSQRKLASKTLDIMLKSFATGGTDLTDVLRVRQQVLDYELKEAEAVADYNTAVAWLQRLMANEPVQ